MSTKTEEEFLDDLSKKSMETLNQGLESGRFENVDSIEGDPWSPKKYAAQGRLDS